MSDHNSSVTLKERTASGMFWSAFGNGAQQVVTMLTGIALARMLNVEDYGLVALLTVFSVIAGNIQESGFTSALGVRRDGEVLACFQVVFRVTGFFSFLIGRVIILIIGGKEQ